MMVEFEKELKHVRYIFLLFFSNAPGFYCIQKYIRNVVSYVFFFYKLPIDYSISMYISYPNEREEFQK